MTPVRLMFPFLAFLLAAGWRPARASDGLDPEQRRCLANKLVARDGRLTGLGEADAFALMDPFTGRVLWAHNPRVLAQGTYEPGSVFKVITTYRALAEKEVDPQATFHCRGRSKDDRSDQVHCWRRRGHGELNLAKALAYSCNLYFADLGKKLGPTKLLAAARDFGLGSSTGSDFPGEVSGSVPASARREEAPWMAVGRGEKVRVTPLQMLSIIGAVANGGVLFSPRLADPGGEPAPERLMLEDAAALRFIRDAMEQASTIGTGRPEGLRALRLAGKTGTSAWSKGFHTHAWYVGYAPFDRPLVALVVFVYRGQGSKEAAALAGRVMEATEEALSGCGVAERGP